MASLRKIVRSFFVAYPEATVVAGPIRRAIANMGKSRDNPFWLLSHIEAPAGTVIVDAGANVGHTAVMLRKCDPDSPIIAFEPSQVNFAELERRTRNLPGMTLHHIALLDKEDSFQLFTPGYKNRYYGTLSSLDKASAAEWLPSFAGIFLDPEKVQIREETATVRPLDSFDLAPRFIKIDVQGVAPGLLRGAMGTLETHRPVMLIERERNDGLAELLRPLGYAEYALHGRTVRPYAGEKDALFVPKDGPVQLKIPGIGT